MRAYVSRTVTIAERIDMFLNGDTNCFLFLTLIYFPLTDAENVFRALEGATVHLPCHSPPEDSVKLNVEWTNTRDNKTSCKWPINNSYASTTKQCIPRFTLNIKSFTLSIENVQPSDSGIYICKTMRLIPPPTVDKNSSLELQVAGLTLQRLNSSSKNNCIDLGCSLEGLNLELVNFTWSREGQMLLNGVTSNGMRSELHLCKPHWSDGDTITCHANYAGSQTQKSIQLEPQHAYEKALADKTFIIAGGAATGLIFCIILTLVVCKCRKQDENGSIVFTNKVYENFSFAMSRQSTQSNVKPQTEECIYEN